MIPHLPPPTPWRVVALAAALAAAIAAAGCAKTHRIYVESDTCWDGAVDNSPSAHLNGCGNATYRVAGEIHCVAVQKQTAKGYLTLRIDDGRPATTTDSLGLVQVCR